MDEDGILRSGATARRHSHPGWLGWTLKDGCGWWQLEEVDRTGRASQGKERPRHTLRKARVPCLRQPRVEQHAIQLGTNRRLLSTAHILLSSCVFAATSQRETASHISGDAVESTKTGLEPSGACTARGSRRVTAGRPFGADQQNSEWTHGADRKGL